MLREDMACDPTAVGHPAHLQKCVILLVVADIQRLHAARIRGVCDDGEAAVLPFWQESGGILSHALEMPVNPYTSSRLVQGVRVTRQQLVQH
jgi:hypothetical protein